MLGVYQECGPEVLETYRVPLLSWEEVKAFKGPDTVGLALGDEGESVRPPLLLLRGMRGCTRGNLPDHDLPWAWALAWEASGRDMDMDMQQEGAEW